MQRRRGMRQTLFVCVMLPGAALAAPAVVAPCIGCHGEAGMGGDDPKVPVIAGIPVAHIEEAIYAYVDGARECVHLEAMCETVATLSNDDVTTAAEYYAARERRPSREDYDPELAEKGAAIHEERCAVCHVPPAAPDVDAALGFPLHGQKRAYLQMALEAYRSGAREALYDAMAEAVASLEAGEFDALAHYYASWRRDRDQD